MDIKAALHQYFRTFLKPGDCRELLDDTPLLSSGLIDSIGVVGLIDFIETRFKIEFLPREIDRNALDTIERIDRAIRAKLSGQGNLPAA